MRSYERHDYDGQRLVVPNALTADDLDEIADRAARELLQAGNSAFTAWNAVRLLLMWIDHPNASRNKRVKLREAWLKATPILIERVTAERDRGFAKVAIEAVLFRLHLLKEPTDELNWRSPADPVNPDIFFACHARLMLNVLDDAVQFETLKTLFPVEEETDEKSARDIFG